MTRKPPVVIGLTGSIGMGKSTTAAMFAEEGIPVWDADSAVHRLYSKAAPQLQRLPRCGQRRSSTDSVSRDALKRVDCRKIPLHLRGSRQSCIRWSPQTGRRFWPMRSATSRLSMYRLLFETGGDKQVDLTVVVSAPGRGATGSGAGATRNDRKAVRKSMVAKQMPDAEKRSRADVVIRNDLA